jgi:hypothetical protein
MSSRLALALISIFSSVIVSADLPPIRIYVLGTGGPEITRDRMGPFRAQFDAERGRVLPLLSLKIVNLSVPKEQLLDRLLVVLCRCGRLAPSTACPVQGIDWLYTTVRFLLSPDRDKSLRT